MGAAVLYELFLVSLQEHFLRIKEDIGSTNWDLIKNKCLMRTLHSKQSMTNNRSRRDVKGGGRN